MPGLRIAAVLGVGLVVCALPTPCPQGVADAAEVPDLLPSSSGRPFAPLARFGETGLRHPAPVRSLALSPDRKTLATTTYSGPVVRLWDTTTGRLVREIHVPCPDGGMLTVDGVSADVRRLLVVRHSRETYRDAEGEREWGIVDTQTGEFRRVGNLAQGGQTPVASPDGTMIAGAGEGGLTIWSFDPNRPSRTFPGVSVWAESPNRVAFSPDSKRVAGFRPNGSLVVARADGHTEREIEVKQGQGYSAVCWPGANRIVAAHETRMATFDADTGGIVTQTERGRQFRTRAWAIEGGVVLAQEYYSGELITVDSDTLTIRPFKKLEYYAWYVASADGKVVAITEGHTVRLLDAKGEPLLPGVARSAPDPAERIDFSADGRRMIATGGATIQTWDLPGGRQLWSARGPTDLEYCSPPRVAISPDGRWVISSAPFDSRTLVRDAETGKVVAGDGKDENRQLAGFDGPGRMWVRESMIGGCTSYPLPGGAAGRTVTLPVKYGFPLSSPDGRWLVMSGARHSLSVLDTRAD
ncbi:MAG TPA: WD40 repeat domain-containing protein, partial [Gemmataceae bacterium]|nr:WD40 repeat domain-containing protein [Gemmataceae bacterium]